MNETSAPLIWKSLPAKPRAYEALHLLNRCFEATLLSLERLESLGLFRLEYRSEYKVRLEHIRAQMNEELIDTLRQYEMEETFRFERMQREWEKQSGDPDDVFFAANDREQEIKEQIKELQKSLEQRHWRRKSRKKR
jgi:molecular chaperone DnaK (HSP70)